MLQWRWTRDTIIDSIKLVCGGLLIAAAATLGLEGTLSWNALLSGYAILTAALAALVAEADWEARANLTLGVWAAVSPFCLGTADLSAVALIHVVAGSVVGLLSAMELWNARRDPPWRFQPGSASRSVHTTPQIAAHANHRGTPIPKYVSRISKHRRRRRHVSFGVSQAGYCPSSRAYSRALDVNSMRSARQRWNERVSGPRIPLTPSVFPDDAMAVIYGWYARP
jgi:hypothetical protein